MISNKVLPAHILRLYVWELMKQEIGMQMVNGFVPILPVEDEPKVADTNKTYAIYGYAENDNRSSEQIREGIFTLRIIAPTFSELGQFTNVMSNAFESTDIATEAVNNFSSRYPNEALIGITFKYVKVTYVEGGEASTDEGGPMDGVVNVAYRYINHLETPIVNSARGGLWS